MLQFPVLVAIYLYTIIVMVFTIACRFAMENIFQVKSATSFNKILPKFLLLRMVGHLFVYIYIYHILYIYLYIYM